MNSSLTLHLAPLLSPPLLYGMGLACLVLLAVSLFFFRRGILWRTLCAAAFMAIFLNPSLVVEERRAIDDVVAVVIDRSASQDSGNRAARTETARAHIEAALAVMGGIEARFVEAPSGGDGAARETRLFEALDRALSDVPAGHRAGAILITDGQVHDAPATPEKLAAYGPVHALLTGDRNESDRQLVVIEAPAYGIVGEKVTIRYRVEDSGDAGDDIATVISRVNDDRPATDLVPAGEEMTLSVTIAHAGQNIVDLQVSPVEGEITMANNRAPLIVNGVRDRLRVLLVSGQPHAGGRTWRNLLTSDPGVDLVHFTILREPNKLDATPQNELSLIAFPFRELFEVKLYDFDLIIFDRYRLNRILPNFYFANIAKYVQEGGALLEASGPSFASEDSVYTTDLKDVLPAYPTGQVIAAAFRPEITEIGRRHPVTENLRWRNLRDPDAGWGSWLRQIAVQPLRGNVVMTGIDDRPLLILDHVGEGRVAQLASDQTWLWSRGYEGGGPQAELLRRLAHWLMKEPELEENALNVTVDGTTVIVRRRTLKDEAISATITAPDGTESRIDLTGYGKNPFLEGRFEGAAPGVYTVDDGTQKRFAVIGDLNPPELRGVITTESRLSPVVNASGGGFIWLADIPEPGVRRAAPGRSAAGKDWVGIADKRSFSVTGVKDIPFLPAWLYALLLLTVTIACWWFEGHRSQA